MTRDDIIRMAREAGLNLYVNDVTEEPYSVIVERFAALVAAAERERLAQPEQEPVGEIVQAFADLTAVSIPVMPPVGTKLYTTPPLREWVGLTGEELDLIARTAADLYDAALKSEAKLKEKNGT